MVDFEYSNDCLLITICDGAQLWVDEVRGCVITQIKGVLNEFSGVAVIIDWQHYGDRSDCALAVMAGLYAVCKQKGLTLIACSFKPYILDRCNQALRELFGVTDTREQAIEIACQS